MDVKGQEDRLFPCVHFEKQVSNPQRWQGLTRHQTWGSSENWIPNESTQNLQFIIIFCRSFPWGHFSPDTKWSSCNKSNQPIPQEMAEVQAQALSGL